MIESDLDLLAMVRYNKGELRKEELHQIIDKLLTDEKFYEYMKKSRMLKRMIDDTVDKLEKDGKL